jgi:two-component system, NtrC family, nitrogen regulation response regulator NtrX
MPPLRERDDILDLANGFLVEANMEFGRGCREISERAAEVLLRYPWPGNVRELRNMTERLMLLATDCQVDLKTVELAMPEAVFTAGGAARFSSGSLADRVQSFEREMILAELKHRHHNVTLAAKSLGLERSHLYKKAEQLGIDLRALRREQDPD